MHSLKSAWLSDRLRTFALVALTSLAPTSLWADAPHEPTYVVKEGDSLGSIALAHNVSVESLRQMNKLDQSKPLRAGKKLSMPAPNRGDGRGGGPTGSSSELTATSGGKVKGVKAGAIRLVRGQDAMQARVLDGRRRLVASTLTEFTRFLKFSDGSTHAIDPRLVTLLGMLSDHFGGRDIMVVSGFRPYSPRQFTPHSNHNVGRAVDFAVRGVPNETVRDFCRQFRNVGVGYYPNSSFVHLDVRDKNAFWIDYAGSGQAPRYHRAESRAEADEGAGEVEGVATVDSAAGPKSGSDVTSSGGSTRSEKEFGKSPERGPGGEHSIFPGRE
jgi:uncharacterized protein YcbK (DUF882 family)